MNMSNVAVTFSKCQFVHLKGVDQLHCRTFKVHSHRAKVKTKATFSLMFVVFSSLLVTIGKQVCMGRECKSLNGLHCIVNRFELNRSDDWTFTSMDTNIDSPTFYT